MKLFLNFFRRRSVPRVAKESQEATGLPSGEVVSQISFSYKDLRFVITRLYDATLGKYSVVAKLGDWEKTMTGLTENEAEEYEESIYALLYPETIKV